MLSLSNTVSALGAITLFASAGHAGAHPQYPPYPLVPRQAAPAPTPGYVQVPLSQLQIFQSEYKQFQGWMSAFFAQKGTNDSAIAQLNNDVQAYDIWVQAFLSMLPNSTTPSSPTGTAGSAASTASAPTPATTMSIDAVPNAATPSSTVPAKLFDATSKRNVAVYYGQTPHSNKVTVDQLCADSSVDIVVLAFLDTFFDAGGMPNINIGPACSGDPTLGAQAINATGLLDCPYLAKNITTCQSLGKKVFLSLGGASGTTNFTSDAQATTFASTVWNLFGGGNVTSNLRPLGTAKIDGFDIDNEDHSTDHYNTFVSALRTHFSTDNTKKYYISAAPQCPRPDESIPLQAMQSMDFVFVQFYNNAQAGCDIGQPGFIKSLRAWAGDLNGNSSVPGKGPMLYVGAPACPKCAGKGYLEPKDIGSVIKSAMAANISNFGGVMLWDGTEGKLNTGNGTDYLGVVKAALS
ncbi:hypothetical protein ACLMJK_006145 [Lecanora helva]